jgi:hypothetical protein
MDIFKPWLHYILFQIRRFPYPKILALIFMKFAPFQLFKVKGLRTSVNLLIPTFFVEILTMVLSGTNFNKLFKSSTPNFSISHCLIVCTIESMGLNNKFVVNNYIFILTIEIWLMRTLKNHWTHILKCFRKMLIFKLCFESKNVIYKNIKRIWSNQVNTDQHWFKFNWFLI